MTSPSPPAPGSAKAGVRPPITLAGLALGARLTLPILPGVVTFALAYGTVAAQKGLSLTDALAMSAILFAGLSQMVALEIWRDAITPSLVLGLAGVVAIVNARLVLMSASLRPWLGPVPSAQVYPSFFFLTDANWLIAMRYHAGGGRDWGVFLGSGMLLWAVWVAASAPGYLVGAMVADPRAWALDLVMPAFFTVLLVPLWRGARRAIPWGVAGLVALATSALVPGYAFVVTGALAGAATGAFLDD